VNPPVNAIITHLRKVKWYYRACSCLINCAELSIYKKYLSMHIKQIPEHQQKRLDYLSTLFREYRLSEGITQKELSINSNLHRNTIIRAESAENLTLLSVFELADTLDINLNDLFQDIK
jgi:DNA-binding XRE family transcriptional regulator